MYVKMRRFARLRVTPHREGASVSAFGILRSQDGDNTKSVRSPSHAKYCVIRRTPPQNQTIDHALKHASRRSFGRSAYVQVTPEIAPRNSPSRAGRPRQGNRARRRTASNISVDVLHGLYGAPPGATVKRFVNRTGKIGRRP